MDFYKIFLLLTVLFVSTLHLVNSQRFKRDAKADEGSVFAALDESYDYNRPISVNLSDSLKETIVIQPTDDVQVTTPFNITTGYSISNNIDNESIQEFLRNNGTEVNEPLPRNEKEVRMAVKVFKNLDSLCEEAYIEEILPRLNQSSLPSKNERLEHYNNAVSDEKNKVSIKNLDEFENASFEDESQEIGENKDENNNGDTNEVIDNMNISINKNNEINMNNTSKSSNNETEDIFIPDLSSHNNATKNVVIDDNFTENSMRNSTSKNVKDRDRRNGRRQTIKDCKKKYNALLVPDLQNSRKKFRKNIRLCCDEAGNNIFKMNQTRTEEESKRCVDNVLSQAFVDDTTENIN